MEFTDTVVGILEELCPNIDCRTCATLVSEQHLDSLALVALVADLEDVFDIEIPPAAVVPENFDSADAICHLVSTLVGEAERTR